VCVVQDADTLLRTLVPKATDELEVGSGDPHSDNQLETHDGGSPVQVMLVLNKADLTSVPRILPHWHTSRMPKHTVSCATGAGLGELESALAGAVKRLLSPEDNSSNTSAVAVEGTMITRERHRRHMKLCVGHLDRFLQGRLPMDAAAEEIR
jgi:tRNA U34 5-carboxymethylaminomethyl modifying GTPase MnmE/TrmE